MAAAPFAHNNPCEHSIRNPSVPLALHCLSLRAAKRREAASAPLHDVGKRGEQGQRGPVSGGASHLRRDALQRVGGSVLIAKTTWQQPVMVPRAPAAPWGEGGGVAFLPPGRAEIPTSCPPSRQSSWAPGWQPTEEPAGILTLLAGGRFSVALRCPGSRRCSGSALQVHSAPVLHPSAARILQRGGFSSED